MFIEPTLFFGPLRSIPLDMEESGKFVWAPHWYDGIQLVTKSYRNWISVDTHNEALVLSKQNLLNSHSGMIGNLMGLVQDVGESGIPTIIGEIGIAMDMVRDDNGIPSAYKTDDYSLQIEAAMPLLASLEQNLASFSWWCYVPDNNYITGDQWNGEDLSVFSPDRVMDESDIFSGGRILEVLVRPYARKVAGEPLFMKFEPLDIERKFYFVFNHSPEVAATFPTEIFVPHYQYPCGFHVTVSDGEFQLHNTTQTLLYYHDTTTEQHEVQILANVCQ